MYIDFYITSNRVGHLILIFKLKLYGLYDFRKSLLSWFNLFLSNRVHIIKYEHDYLF